MAPAAPRVLGKDGGAPPLGDAERRSLGLPTFNTREQDRAALPQATLVAPDIRKIAASGTWAHGPDGENRRMREVFRQRGQVLEETDQRVSFTDPESVAVASPAIFPREYIQQEHPDMLKRIVGMLQPAYDALSEEQRARDPFWQTFEQMPEYAASTMLATLFSDLVAPRRGAESTPMSKAEVEAQRNHPVQQWVDWVNYPTWNRNFGGRRSG